MEFLKTISHKMIFTIVMIAGTSSVMAQQNQALFEQAALQLISKQFSFTEGPASDKNGNVFFTDQPNNKIWKYDTSGNLSVFMERAGRSNGTYFDRKGNLVTCADENQQLWSIDPKGKVTVLVSDLGGKHLNGPNDLWIDPKGGIYITDPYYQRDYWTRKASELDGQKVYYLPKGKKNLVLVTDSLKKPNGIVGTPDGKTLYIADIGASRIYKFSIQKDGKLSDMRIFINQGADGITLDEMGNLYLSGKGVTIFNPAGQQIGHIDVPEPWTANLCFGGKDKNELFITASTALYKIPMRVKGAK
ncbi:SMP-30/gluconolactonase/LRE family protein [Pedobacter duraquae]|uniref:Gluconolactonase n=1 Tax=Pedobacter duraquae TaxID=425511 RepID=A0A4R6IK75_9SPHI|nr:SMP-30/gluconolactonase/LRE family protein [Pedobacter duraquae]TDO22421.1 gluconolactonase [Pedobacter duraquae]